MSVISFNIVMDYNIQRLFKKKIYQIKWYR